MSKTNDNIGSSVEGKISEDKLHDILVQGVSNGEIEKQLAVFIHIKEFKKNTELDYHQFIIYKNVNTREVEQIETVLKKHVVYHYRRNLE